MTLINNYDIPTCMFNIVAELYAVFECIYGYDSKKKKIKRILVEWNDSGDSMIKKTLKRSSSFSRANPTIDSVHEQLVAANFDYVFIMQSLNNNFISLYFKWQFGDNDINIVKFSEELGSTKGKTKPLSRSSFYRLIEFMEKNPVYAEYLKLYAHSSEDFCNTACQSPQAAAG